MPSEMNMANLPPDYPSHEEMTRLLAPIDGGLEDQRRKGWQPASIGELLEVAYAEVKQIRLLVASGWRPKIWGAGKKLIEPLVTVYDLAPTMLTAQDENLLKFLVVKEKFLRIQENLSSLEQKVLRSTIKDHRDLKNVLRLRWPEQRKPRRWF